MERYKHLLVAAILGLSLILSTYIASKAIVRVFRIRHQDHVVTVTGSAKRRIQSDLVVWRAHIHARAPQLADAYRELSTNVPKVTAFLQAEGIASKAITISAINTTEVHPRRKEGDEVVQVEEIISLYELEQTVEVTSTEVQKIANVANDATKLIEQGVVVTSDEPRYLYTKLAELKVQMLAEASKDTRVRAEQITSNTGSRIVSLQSAKMGVMQINAANKSEITAQGVNDTTSLDKDVMAVVTASFDVDAR